MEKKYDFEVFPGTSLSVFRFQGLQNGAELKDAIVAKKLAADAAFIDKEAVPDMFLLQLATFKALVAQVCGKYTTHVSQLQCAEVAHEVGGLRRVVRAS